MPSWFCSSRSPRCRRPITYDVHRVVYYPFSPDWQTFYVDGWIQTDGTLGEWGTHLYVSDYDIRLHRSTGQDGGWLTPETSTIAYTWGVHATESELFFRPGGNFSEPGQSAQFAILTPTHEDAWVLTTYCSRGGLCDENVQTDYWSAQIGRSRPNQSYAFATAARCRSRVPRCSMLTGLLAIRRWCRR